MRLDLYNTALSLESDIYSLGTDAEMGLVENEELYWYNGLKPHLTLSLKNLTQRVASEAYHISDSKTLAYSLHIDLSNRNIILFYN